MVVCANGINGALVQLKTVLITIGLNMDNSENEGGSGHKKCSYDGCIETRRTTKTLTIMKGNDAIY